MPKKKKATPKKRINSRAKGASYERKIAKILGEWWGEKFSKTPASGGLQWGADNRVAGDIVPPPDSKFPYTVECKNQEGWDFSQIITGVGKIPDFWEQCTRDAEKVSRVPMLVFSKNHAPDYFMLLEKDWDKIIPIEFNYYKTRITLDGTTQDVAIGLVTDLITLTPAKIIKSYK